MLPPRSRDSYCYRIHDVSWKISRIVSNTQCFFRGFEAIPAQYRIHYRVFVLSRERYYIEYIIFLARSSERYCIEFAMFLAKPWEQCRITMRFLENGTVSSTRCSSYRLSNSRTPNAHGVSRLKPTWTRGIRFERKSNAGIIQRFGREDDLTDRRCIALQALLYSPRPWVPDKLDKKRRNAGKKR